MNTISASAIALDMIARTIYTHTHYRSQVEDETGLYALGSLTVAKAVADFDLVATSRAYSALTLYVEMMGDIKTSFHPRFVDGATQTAETLMQVIKGRDR